jgi:hypothetical protein
LLEIERPIQMVVLQPLLDNQRQREIPIYRPQKIVEGNEQEILPA